jgi:Tfp pilus assembly protein PilF
MIICPILSQQRQDENGSVEWQHHECLKDGCVFWAAEADDCGIRASGIQILKNAGGEPSADRSDPDEIRRALTAALERFGDLERKLVSFSERAAGTNRDLGIKVLEGVAALEQPVGGLREVGEELQGRFEGLRTDLEKVRELMEDMASSAGEKMRGLSGEVDAVQSRTAGIEEKVTALSERFCGLERPMEALREENRVSHEAVQGLSAAMERMGSRMDETGSNLEERLRGLEEPIEFLRQESDALRTKFDAISDLAGKAAAIVEEARTREEERSRRESLEEARELNARGMALFHKGACDAAETAFRASLERDPELAEAHNNLGMVLGRAGRADEAVSSFERALELRPDLGSALNNLGFLCHESMEFEKAVELFRKAASTDSDSSVAYTNMGNALYRLERASEAVEAWRMALREDPHNENAARALRMYEGEGACS